MENNNQRPVTAAEYAYNEIKSWILSGELTPDERLNLSDIGTRLGVSRIPIRGAIDKLSSEGLVETLPHRGTIVTPLSAKHLESTFSMRCALESIAVIKAMNKASVNDFKKIKTLLDEQVHSSTDIEVVMRQNRDFHFCLFALADDEILVKMLEGLWEKSNRYRRIFYSQYPQDTIARIVKEHYELLECIMRGEKQDAVDLITLHTRQSQESLLRHLNTDIEPEYFHVMAVD